MTSLMGLPHPIQDAEILCQLPVFPESNQRTTTLDMHIKLSRVIAEINNSTFDFSNNCTDELTKISL